MHNQEFLILPAEEVCRLLASDDLNVPDEETIFQALVMWAKHDLSNRKKYLAKLLSHIKLPLMSPQVLLGSTYQINLIKLFWGVKTQSRLSGWFIRLIRRSLCNLPEFWLRVTFPLFELMVFYSQMNYVMLIYKDKNVFSRVDIYD